MNEKVVMTICFLVKGNQICLGRKKRGFRVGKLNGFGGKLEKGETVEACALRETFEESGVRPAVTEKVAVVTFYFDGKVYECHIFIYTSWTGEPVETEEMAPNWYLIDEIPFDQMGEADPIWIPRVLNGERLMFEFFYDDNDVLCKSVVRGL